VAIYKPPRRPADALQLVAPGRRRCRGDVICGDVAATGSVASFSGQGAACRYGGSLARFFQWVATGASTSCAAGLPRPTRLVLLGAAGGRVSFTEGAGSVGVSASASRPNGMVKCS